ncbi:MAG: discoidin domain-containing protein [Acetatifactor sp.]|nr:discoidin domain-containing protein [Acetatifactor sp.]
MKSTIRKRVIAGILTGVIILAECIVGMDARTVYASNEIQEDNSIINWAGLPEISEEKVQKVAESGVTVEFTHPGIFANKENLDTMRQMIHEGYDPWFSAFEKFRDTSLASKEYVNSNQDRSHTYLGEADRQDANAAYAQAVMWWVTGDKDYFDKAIDIVRSYSESYDAELFATEQDGGYGWSADIITAGMVFNKLTLAAEILRYATVEVPYENAWTDVDTENYMRVLEMAYPLYDRVDKWMNQTAFTFQAMIASAVFQDDPDMYETVIERATVNSQAQWHLAGGSIKWQARLVDTTITLEDFYDGDDNLTLVHPAEPIVQWAEMGRDQPHSQAGIALLSSVAQTAYIQGTKVNEDGQIMTDGTGTNLFDFLDDRLCKGANYYYQYNLGYDVEWYPLAKGYLNDIEECGPVIGANGDAGWWTYVSHGNRYTLGGSGVLYYYYKYQKGLSDTDPNFRYIVEAQSIVDDYEAGGDATTNATMMIAPVEARTGEPKGAPQIREVNGYEANVAGSGRIFAKDFTGAYASGMSNTARPSLKDFSDEMGNRATVQDNYPGDYLWFQNVDLGEDPVDTFILRSASNSSQGTHFKLILLDDVNVQDWSAVTSAELDAGEVLVDDYSGGTGWWTSFATKLFTMTRQLSGTHSFAFLHLGSDNVYRYTASLDWMAFSNYFAYEANAVKDASVLENVSVDGDNAVLQNGSVFGWDSMDMDIGNSGLTMNIASGSEGTLKLYRGTPGNEPAELIATYAVPYTGGVMMTINVPGEHYSTIRGNQDIYYVYEGSGNLIISSICSYHYVEETVERVQGENYSLIKSGQVTNKTDDDITYAEFQSGSIAFYRLGTEKKIVSFRVRTNGKAVLTMTNDISNGGEITDEQAFYDFGILKLEIPNTYGNWTTFQCDLSDVAKSYSKVYLSVTGDVDLDYIMLGQDNTPPEIVSLAYQNPVFSVEKEQGGYTDYLLVDQNYNIAVETFDFDEDPVATYVSVDQLFESNNGIVTILASEPGEREAWIVADDGNTWTAQKRNLVILESLDDLIEAVGTYDTNKRYSRASLSAYEQALATAQMLAAGGYTQDFVNALENLNRAVENLVMIVPTEADGSIDYIKYADELNFARYSALDGGYSENQQAIIPVITSLMDGNSDTFIEWRHSQNANAASFTIDFGDGLGVKLSKFELQSRQGFGSRTANVSLEASNDGDTWVTISQAGGAANTDAMQTLYITSDYEDVPFRYIRLYNPRVNASGANSFLSIAEFHIFGRVVEQEPLLSFKMNGIKFEQLEDTHTFVAEMGEALFTDSDKIPVFKTSGGAKLYQGETELTSGVTPIEFTGEETGQNAKRTAIVTAQNEGLEQDYTIEITFNTIALEGPVGLSWDGKNVSFNASLSEENVDAYRLCLYKDDAEVEGSVVTLEKNDAGTYSYYYGAMMQEGGTYTFRVTAKAAETSEDFTDSEPVISPTRNYSPAEVLKGELIASFDFEDLESGVTEVLGGGAKATVMGSANYGDSYDGGKAAKLSSAFWLDVTKNDGTPLLKGMDEITISYDAKYDASGNVGWTFFAAPSSGSVNGSKPTYFGILDRTAGIRAERYLNARTADTEKKSNISGWKHVDVVITKTNFTIYVDGEQWATRDCSTVQLTDILTETGGVLQIGKGNWGSGEYYSGLMDHLEIYYRNTAAAEEEAAIAAAGEAVAEAVEAMTLTQSETPTAQAAKEQVEAILAELDLGEVVAEVATTEFEEAQAGTVEDEDGTDGSYSFTVTLSRGNGEPVVMDEMTVVISATAYIPEEMPSVSDGDAAEEEPQPTVSDGDASSEPEFPQEEPREEEPQNQEPQEEEPQNQEPQEEEPQTPGQTEGENNTASAPAEDIVNWDVIVDVIAEKIAEVAEKLGTGNGRIPMNENLDFAGSNETVVPVSVLGMIQGQPVTVAFHSKTGVALSISGQDIKNVSALQNIDLSIDDEVEKIPENVVEAKHAKATKQIAVKDTGDFAVRVNMHVALGEENSGKYANLYRYNAEKSRLEYCSSFRIVSCGNAVFSLECGGDYVVTVTERRVNERVRFSGTGYEVEKGDSLFKIARRNNMSLAQLLQLNPQIKDSSKLQVGQKIHLK